MRAYPRHAQMLELPRSFADRTSISAGLEFSMSQFERAPFKGVRLTAAQCLQQISFLEDQLKRMRGAIKKLRFHKTLGTH